MERVGTERVAPKDGIMKWDWKQIECDGCGTLLGGWFFRWDDSPPEVYCEGCLEKFAGEPYYLREEGGPETRDTA